MTDNVKPMKKVILIGMADSVHVARWLKSTLSASELEVFLVPTSPHRRVHPEILSMIGKPLDSGSRLSIHSLLRFTSIIVWVLDRQFLFAGRVRALFVGRAIESHRPDLVHIMETQNGGYPYLAYAAKSPKAEAERKYRLALTLFGSDLFWFSRFPAHKLLLSRLLPKIDVLAAECERDIVLAKELGFGGKVAQLSPVSGGLDPIQIAQPESAEDFVVRDVIAIKGYGGTWGLGHVAIEELAKVSDKLVGKRIVVFSAERTAKKAAEKYLRPLGVRYQLYPKFALSHSAMLRLYRQSLIYVGLSRSDGLPASMLEAMSQGAFPVQTSSACTDGWFEPNVSGVVVDADDVSQVGKKVADLLANPSLMRLAQHSNLATINARYSRATVSKQLTYDEMLDV
jgi:glycosyltransferase involved in cell wall biosynthesis